jgi:hypothetical protein
LIQIPSATASIIDNRYVYLGSTLILDSQQEDPGCFGATEISYSPTKEYFLIILGCFEGDNDLFLVRADGKAERQISGKWDHLLYDKYEWSADGQSLFYFHVRSCCEDNIPSDTIPDGLVRYDIRTAEKTWIAEGCGRVFYRVINVPANEALNVRSEPGLEEPIIGVIPADGTNIEGTGISVIRDGMFWVPIRYETLTGWVACQYLTEQPKAS